MTRASCPACRLRFDRAMAAHITACPACGGPLTTASAQDALGLRLFSGGDDLHPLRQAVAALLPAPPSDGRLS